MRGNIELLGYSILAPACVAVFVAWLCRKALPADVGSRYALAAGAALGFASGYALLPDWAPLVPERHWQWLPYFGLGAAIIGATSLASGVRFWERWLMYLALAIVAAWQLVPTWDTLQPPRAIWIPLLTANLVLLSALLSALPERLLGRSFSGILAGTCLVIAVIVGYEVSAKFGLVGVTLAAAAAGCSISTLFTKQVAAEASSPFATESRGLVAVFALLAGSLAFVGTVEPAQPAFAMLLLPAAPLVLWLFTLGPLARVEGITGAAIRVLTVAVLLALLAAWLNFGGKGDEWGP